MPPILPSVNALAQLEEQVRENRYLEIVQTLAVSSSCHSYEVEDHKLTSHIGREADFDVIETVQCCTENLANLATGPGVTRGNPYQN